MDNTIWSIEPLKYFLNEKHNIYHLLLLGSGRRTFWTFVPKSLQHHHKIYRMSHKFSKKWIYFCIILCGAIRNMNYRWSFKSIIFFRTFVSFNWRVFQFWFINTKLFSGSYYLLFYLSFISIQIRVKTNFGMEVGVFFICYICWMIMSIINFVWSLFESLRIPRVHFRSTLQDPYLKQAKPEKFPQQHSTTIQSVQCEASTRKSQKHRQILSFIEKTNVALVVGSQIRVHKTRRKRAHFLWPHSDRVTSAADLAVNWYRASGRERERRDAERIYRSGEDRVYSLAGSLSCISGR